MRVKRARTSGRVFWVAVALAAGGMILPWLKGPERLPRAYVEAAEGLRQGTRTALGPGDFLWVDFSELVSSFRDPLVGAGVWQLFGKLLVREDAADGCSGRHGAELLTRPDYFPAGAYAMVFSPVVVLAVAFFGARGLRESPWVWMCGLLMVGVYGVGRWRVAATAGARAAAEIEMGPGVWLTMLAALLAGLLLLARWYFPRAKWL